MKELLKWKKFFVINKEKPIQTTKTILLLLLIKRSERSKGQGSGDNDNLSNAMLYSKQGVTMPRRLRIEIAGYHHIIRGVGSELSLSPDP